ncbi:MAG: Acetyl-coenzyme A synthetase [Lentisphaerae bacterium ADurb.BinA184]|nr:MAG: Acetyl-coenzyme A synthetase [Lentisphaerae bacterium ADurb.BinA184]
MLKYFLARQDFRSYEDFAAHMEIRVPTDFNFGYDVVDVLAGVDPGRRALVWCDDKGGQAQFSFAEVKRESDRAANLFRGCGVRKGDAVMLVLKRRYEFWFCLLALHKLGAVAIPATHLLTRKDIAYRIKAASIAAIVAVADGKVAEEVDAAVDETGGRVTRVMVGGDRPGWVSYDDRVRRMPERFERPQGSQATTNRDPLLLYFTSGTTGMPKMVQHNCTYPLGHILTARYWQNVRPGGLHLTVADTGWAKAAWGKIYGQWLSGAAVMVYDYDRFVPRAMLDVLTGHGVTSFCAPPTVFRFLIKEDLSRYRFPALEYCTVAGEPLNPEVFQQFHKATGLALMEGYGQTELTVTIGTFPWLEPRPGSMGKPSPGYDIDLLDEDGHACGPGEDGQIVLRTDRHRPVGMFDGYCRDPELTRSVWHDGLYYTGDMARRDADGYYWFVGRADDLIKSSGYRIGPFEVESALLEHPAVLECAVTGVADPDRGQVVKATVVLARGYTGTPELATDLQNHVRRVTAPYKYPRLIEFVDELPKTISGKIRRVAIRSGDHRPPPPEP